MKRKTLTLTAAGLLVSAAALCLYAQSRQEKQETIVIGKELLKAEEAEKRRKAGGEAGVSPMPPGRYESNDEELELVNPKPNDFDAALTELCRRYARSDPATRRLMRRSIDADDLYVLWNFAKRAAVFGFRERSVQRLTDGLTAIALIERERVDFRDLYGPLGLLHYVAVQTGAPHQKLFGDAAALAEPGTADIIRAGLRWSAKDANPRSSGFEQVETESGVGFLFWFHPEKYAPTYDLKSAVVDVARLLAAEGKYGTVGPWAGIDFTGHLLVADDYECKRVLASVRAAAKADTFLAPGLLPEGSLYQLEVYLVEMADEQSARTLLDIAQRKEPSGYHTLALRGGRLVCLVAAGYMVGEGEHFETPESLRRFEKGLAEILRRHASKYRPAAGRRPQ